MAVVAAAVRSPKNRKSASWSAGTVSIHSTLSFAGFVRCETALILSHACDFQNRCMPFCIHDHPRFLEPGLTSINS